MPSTKRWVVSVWCALAALWSPGVQAGANKWTQTALYGGPSYSVAVDPKNPDIVYEASPGGGVFKSIDGGGNWESANVGLTDLDCQSIVIDPTNPKILYTSGQSNVFKSTNGAKSWASIGALYDGREYIVDPKTPSTLYGLSGPYGAATVAKSVDGGQTWTSLVNGLTDYGLVGLAMDPRSPSTLYVAAVSGVYKSIDGGQTWISSTSGLGGNVNAVAVDPLNSLVLYALSDSGPGVYKSVDGGQTWAASGTGIPQEDDPSLVAVDPKKPNFVYVVVGGPYSPNFVYASRDAGAHWTIASSGLPKKFSVNLRSLVIAPSAPAALYLGTDLGVFASLDRGETWTRRVDGLANMSVNAVAVDPVTPTTVYAATAFSGMFKSVDDGIDWTPINGGLPGGFVGNTISGVNGVSSIAINPRNTSELFIGTAPNISGQPCSVFKSVDAGATWKTSVGGALSDRPYDITALAIDPNNPKTLFAGDSRGFGVAKSTDAGATWSWVDSGLPSDMPVGKLVIAPNSIAVTSAVNADFTGFGFLLYFSPYASDTTADPTWSVANVSNSLSFLASYSGETPTVTEVATVAVDLSTTGVLNLGGSGNSNFDPTPCKPYTGLFLDPFAKKSFYMTGQCGVVLVANLGATVTQMNAGLPAGLTVNGIATTPSGKVLYAATAGGGVYKYTIDP